MVIPVQEFIAIPKVLIAKKVKEKFLTGK